ncbi:MAG: OmpA family protein [Flavobacteriales bacterium]
MYHKSTFGNRIVAYRITLIWTLLLACAMPCASAQQHTTVLTNPADTISPHPGHRIVISYYTPASEQNLNEFQTLISSYLDLYLDNCATLEDGDVKLKKGKKQTLKEMNNIVTNALGFYDYQPLKAFKTFSANVDEKLDAIDKLDFSRTQFSAGASDFEAARQMEKFYFQREIENLKELARMELGIYAKTNVLVKSSTEETFVDAATKQKLIEQYTSGNKTDLIQPIRIELSDASVAMLNMEDTSSLTEVNNTATENFSVQVLKLLEANNAKLDGMQQQINDLRTEQVRLWQQSQDEKNMAMQNQIDDLREMVMALVGMKTGEPVASVEGTSLPTNTTRAVIKNVPGTINILFEKNSATLDVNSKMMLNEVVDLLAREPSMHIVITGYADRTGDAAHNIVLSQQRAKAVQKFIAESGLSSAKLVTNYFGDRDSASENAQDRKVSIDFVTK